MKSLPYILLACFTCFAFGRAEPARQQAPHRVTTKTVVNNTVHDFVAMLDAADKTDLYSISRALDWFNERVIEEPVAVRDTVFREFRIFFYALIAYHNDRIWEDLDFLEKLHARHEPPEPEIDTFLQALANNGLSLFTLGKLLYIDQREEYLYKIFYPYLSPAAQAFLSLRRAELTWGFSDNDMLVISFADVGMRIISWERYLDRFPDGILSSTARHYYQVYLSTFLTGLRRSPVFNKRGRAREAVMLVHRNFILQNYDTAAGKLVEQYYDTLTRVDFRWSRPVREFFEAHNITNMHTAQVPLR